MSPYLFVQLLGGVRIRVDERDVAGFRSRTAEALLVYLLMHKPRVFSRSWLAEFFWEERSEKQAAANLRTVLSMLKKSLGDFLLIDRQTVAIDPDAVIDVDALTFEDRLQALLSQPSPNPEALAATLALYQGDFLEGFHLSESRRFQEWEVMERERLQQLAARGFRRWAGEAMRRGCYEEAAIAAERLIRVDPYDEAGYCLHMEALLRQGRNPAALRSFRAGRAFLREELGMGPGPRHDGVGRTHPDHRLAATFQRPSAGRALVRTRSRVADPARHGAWRSLVGYDPGRGRHGQNATGHCSGSGDCSDRGRPFSRRHFLRLPGVSRRARTNPHHPGPGAFRAVARARARRQAGVGLSARP